MGKLKSEKAAGKNEVTREIVKGRGESVVDCIWRLRNMAFESGVITKYWISAVKKP